MNVNDPMGKGPKEPHLGLLAGEGSVIAIPRGATLVEIIDPSDSRAITPLVLVEVKPGHWTFRCSCNAQCRMVYRFRATAEGSHDGSKVARPMKGARLRPKR